MSARDLQPVKSALELLGIGRMFIGPLSTLPSDSAQPTKICIGCGARQAADGSLPCGHDNDL
ncbi:hypothetical protein NK8_12550 [Caballeronia sp. NK8]|uniref:hypothetical protein n=1 Tax=Caballeronia sp. NK8 TaxID=140098 RepID=UPI001BB5C9F5|nr:hypothetical protein [Caballeronia sp. NK8]BCQ23130.1 hypothetical protein NK8_12550 [Caballeronia sp. NK8]